MQESIDLFVLSSEAHHHAMSDANAIPDAATLPATHIATADAPFREISPESTDEQLMLALRDGSEPAFTLLFARYKQPIFGFFSRRLNDSSGAEELTQETFVALFRAAKRYEPRALFRTYLYAIAFRILRTDRRKSQFRAVFFGAPKAAESAAARNQTEDHLWIRRALHKLDPTDREIVMLREYQQLSYAEIAALLEIPLNTVRSRLFRAREALRNLLVPPNTQQAPPTCSAGRSPLSPARPRQGEALSGPQTADEPTRAKKGDRP
jgi:RNA polymerase sigma-70 factor, ECF subfamily